MKKVISLLMIVCMLLCACGEPADDPSATGNVQSSTGVTTKPDAGNSGEPNEPAPTEPTKPAPTHPTYAFDPCGTWVWEGNDALTLTLNPDGTAKFNDPEEWLLTFWWFQDEEGKATYTYDETAGQVKILFVDGTGEYTYEKVYNVIGDYGYYMIDGGEFDHSFVPAENFEDANARFLDMDNYLTTFYADKQVVLNQPFSLVSWRDGDTIVITDYTLEKVVEGNDVNYCLRFYFTLTVTETMHTPSDFFDYTVKYVGSSSNEGGVLYPYDLSGNEITSVPAGSTVQGYCEKILYGGTYCDHLLRWFNGPMLKLGINGVFAFYINGEQ